MHDGRIASDAWVTRSWCRHYKIEPEAAAFGPVWTDAEYRGKGFATSLIKLSMNRLLPETQVFYVDTATENVSMQKVIAKCGFCPVTEERSD
jgi:RimJ/RimL family protein N-acetyltransferase